MGPARDGIARPGTDPHNLASVVDPGSRAPVGTWLRGEHRHRSLIPPEGTATLDHAIVYGKFSPGDLTGVVDVDCDTPDVTDWRRSVWLLLQGGFGRVVWGRRRELIAAAEGEGAGEQRGRQQERDARHGTSDVTCG